LTVYRQYLEPEELGTVASLRAHLLVSLMYDAIPSMSSVASVDGLRLPLPSSPRHIVGLKYGDTGRH
jgi:hypothetical protein